jgi:hypothetical protein
MSINESLIDKFRVRDSASGEIIADPVLDAVSGAIRKTREGAERLAAIAAAVGNDKTMTPEAAALKAKDAALKVGDQIAPQLDEARGRAIREIESLERATSCPPPGDAVAMQLESELRATLRAAKKSDRDKIVKAAIDGGDDSVIGAVLRGHAALVGMTAEEQNARREEWRVARYPQEADRIGRLKRAVEAIGRAGGAFVNMVSRLTDNPQAVAAEAGAAKAKAALEAVA